MQYLERKIKMKLKNVMASVIVMMATVSHAQTMYKDSPYNFENSEYNYDNSPFNFKNSPYNFDNYEYNYNSPNAIYDNTGHRTGYTTVSPAGVRNYYTNEGRRAGYTPYTR